MVTLKELLEEAARNAPPRAQEPEERGPCRYAVVQKYGACERLTRVDCRHPELGGPVTLHFCQTCRFHEPAENAMDSREKGGLPTQKKAEKGHVLFFTTPNYREGPTREAIQRLKDAGWNVAEARADSRAPAWRVPELASVLPADGPRAVIRWEECGGLFANEGWQRACAWCHERGILPLQIDFGYFNHYRTLILDPYQADGLPSIRALWDGLPVEPQWHLADPALQRYRDYMADEWEIAGNLGPVPGTQPGYVLIYLQYSCSLSIFPASSYAEWGRRVHDAIVAAGLLPVWKKSRVQDVKLPEGALVFGESDGIEHLNTRLLRYARHAVIITSTVSNEAVLRGLPVVSCGRAWHSGLGVFAEAKDWADLAVTSQVDRTARARWTNWWIRRSFSPERIAERLEELVRPRKVERASFLTGVGMGNLLMAVPAMKAFHIATGARLRVGSGRRMARGYAALLEPQPWVEAATSAPPNLGECDAATGAAFAHERQVLESHNGPARIAMPGEAVAWPHEVLRDAVPARTVGFTGILPSAKIRVPPVPEKFKLPASYVVVGMDCTDGPTWSKRRWPHWEAFAMLWRERYRVPLVLIGVTQAPQAKGCGLDLTGSTTPQEVASIIAEADAYVGIDNGPSHLAAAVRTPSVLLYGPTTSLQNGPWQGSVTVLSADVPCRPCFHWREWGTCRDCRCMSEIAPERVCEVLARVLERHGQPVRSETCFEQAQARFNVSQRIGCPPAQRLGELARLWEVMEELRPRMVVEIGSLRGGWLYTMAPTCAERAFLVGIDSAKNAARKRVEHELAREGHRVRWLIADSHSGETVLTLRGVLEGRPVDVLHIDGDHSREGVLRDWDLYSPLVRPGGLVLLHDAANPTEEVPAALAELQKRRDSRVQSWQLAVDPHGRPPLGIAIARMR